MSGARAELRLAQRVAQLGVREAGRQAPTIPSDVLAVPAGLDVSIIGDDVIAALDGDLYGEVPRPEILPQYRSLPGAVASVDRGAPERSPGSNNWAIGGSSPAPARRSWSTIRIARSPIPRTAT